MFCYVCICHYKLLDLTGKPYVTVQQYWHFVFNIFEVAIKSVAFTVHDIRIIDNTFRMNIPKLFPSWNSYDNYNEFS